MKLKSLFSILVCITAFVFSACGKSETGMFRTVELPDGISGSLHFHSMPGRYEPLNKSVTEIADKKIDVVVCLTSLAEIREKAPDYATAIDGNLLGFQRLDFPIVDFGVPEDSEAFLALTKDLAQELKAGKNILVHCGAGIGRTGTTAAGVLIVLGEDVDEALEVIKNAGSGPETKEQMDLVFWVANKIKLVVIK